MLKLLEKYNSVGFSNQIYHWCNSGLQLGMTAIAIGELGSEYGLIKKPATLFLFQQMNIKQMQKDQVFL